MNPGTPHRRTFDPVMSGLPSEHSIVMSDASRKSAAEEGSRRLLDALHRYFRRHPEHAGGFRA